VFCGHNSIIRADFMIDDSVQNFPIKAGCLAAVKTAQEGGEPKPAALRSELLRSVFLIFWGQKNELSIDR
jgi:hypothetical protein